MDKLKEWAKGPKVDSHTYTEVHGEYFIQQPLQSNIIYLLIGILLWYP